MKVVSLSLVISTCRTKETNLWAFLTRLGKQIQVHQRTSTIKSPVSECENLALYISHYGTNGSSRVNEGKFPDAKRAARSLSSGWSFNARSTSICSSSTLLGSGIQHS